MKQTQTIQFKILVVLASALLLVLFLIGIIQTFSHKSLAAKNQQLQNQNDTVQSEIDKRQQDKNFFEDPNGSEIVNH